MQQGSEVHKELALVTLFWHVLGGIYWDAD